MLFATYSGCFGVPKMNFNKYEIIFFFCQLWIFLCQGILLIESTIFAITCFFKLIAEIFFTIAAFHVSPMTHFNNCLNLCWCFKKANTNAWDVLICSDLSSPKSRYYFNSFLIPWAEKLLLPLCLFKWCWPLKMSSVEVQGANGGKWSPKAMLLAYAISLQITKAT